MLKLLSFLREINPHFALSVPLRGDKGQEMDSQQHKQVFSVQLKWLFGQQHIAFLVLGKQYAN